MNRFFLAFALLLLATEAPPASAPVPMPGELQAGGRAIVTRVVDGDTVLTKAGDEIRLVGIQAPKLPLGRPDFEPWPLADEARAALEDLVLGRTVRLAYGGLRSDRHRRRLAHLAGPDGAWIQGEMLRRGLARVYTFPDNRALAAEMHALEREARTAGRGIWADPHYAVRDPGETRELIGTFQVVEGTVLDAAEVRGRHYLNFGPDWRTDFTVSIAPRDLPAFEAAGVDPLALAGRAIRVRGWLIWRNGPMIEADHPEQIERAAPRDGA